MNKSKLTPVVLLLTIILFFPVWVQADDDKKNRNPFKKLQRQINGLYHKVHRLKVKVARLEEENAAQNGVISTLQAQVADLLSGDAGALAAIFDGVSRTDDDIFFDGVNVHIRNGLGETDGVEDGSPISNPGVTNGLGNLIVGYNEARISLSDKTGSHNLIIGPNHNYSSYGGLVAGRQNTISGIFSTVSGGSFNRASGAQSSVGGGSGNRASGFSSGVSGGSGNGASGGESSVGGGMANRASGAQSSVSGGGFNIASGNNSSVSGGINNRASGAGSSVSGGGNNEASGGESSVSGGLSRNTSSIWNWAAGNLFETN
jgi:hypothetical protein